jgi:hypothetical protein
MDMVCQECYEHAKCQDHDKPAPAALAPPATIGATGDKAALPVASVTVTAVTVATAMTAAVATATAAATVVQGYAYSPR